MLAQMVEGSYVGEQLLHINIVHGFLPPYGFCDIFNHLSRQGEDTNTYYDVKIKASRLLLAHMEDTFVTPVFNGSASLRDAAGQMIENVAKSIRRKVLDTLGS